MKKNKFKDAYKKFSDATVERGSMHIYKEKLASINNRYMHGLITIAEKRSLKYNLKQEYGFKK